MKVLFVCLGNICRSPTAQGVLSYLAKRHGVDIAVDSAGTAAYHLGKAPDPRSQSAAFERGIDMSRLKARQVRVEDFYDFDMVFAMDQQNLADLKSLRPDDAKAELSLFLDVYGSLNEVEVPDPYYGGQLGFDRVLDFLFDACENFLQGRGLK